MITNNISEIEVSEFAIPENSWIKGELMNLEYRFEPLDDEVLFHMHLFTVEVDSYLKSFKYSVNSVWRIPLHSSVSDVYSLFEESKDEFKKKLSDIYPNQAIKVMDDTGLGGTLTFHDHYHMALRDLHQKRNRNLSLNEQQP